MLVIVTILVLLAVVHYLLVTSRQGWLTAETIAVISMLTMVFGLISLDDGLQEPFIQFSALCYAASIGGMIFTAVLKAPVKRHPMELPKELIKPTKTMMVILLFSAGIIGLYFAAAGSVPFVAGLLNLFGGSDYNIRDLRLDTYKGDQYLAPGYVNQFKNVLFPALASVAIMYLWRTGRGANRIWAALLAAAVVVALFGTGQRHFGVVYGAAVVIAYVMVRGKVQRGKAIQALLAIAVVFVLSTAALGRSSALAEDAGSWNEAIGVYVVEAVERFSNVQQASALLAEQVVGDRTYPLLSDWWNTFAGYLPGQSNRPSIAAEVGAYFASNVTTMPPSSVTSAKLNLSPFGAVVFFFMWGIVLALVSRYYMSAKGGSPLYFIGSGGVMFVLGTWVADAPFTMLQTGLVMFAIIAYVGKRQYTQFDRRRQAALKAAAQPDVAEVGNARQRPRRAHSA